MSGSYGLQAHEAIAATNGRHEFAWSDSRNGSTTAPIEDYYFRTAVHSTPARPRSFGSGTALGIAIRLLGAGVVLALAVLAIRT